MNHLQGSTNPTAFAQLDIDTVEHVGTSQYILDTNTTLIRYEWCNIQVFVSQDSWVIEIQKIRG